MEVVDGLEIYMMTLPKSLLIKQMKHNDLKMLNERLKKKEI